jgi:hypothetical protein
MNEDEDFDDDSFKDDFETDDEQELYVSAALIYLTNTSYSTLHESITMHMFLHYEGWRWRCWGRNITCWHMVGQGSIGFGRAGLGIV